MMIERYSQILVEFFERMNSWEHGIVADRGISLPQMHLLEVVGNHGQIRMKDLASRMGVTTGTLTVMAHRLVTKGYLVKEKDPEDNRSSFVTLSVKGRREYEMHHHLHGHLIEEIVSFLGDERAASFFKDLEEIRELM
ncbi:MAG: MarR family transcriptional regulator [Sphaerochaetaceae bacterium]|nr:MarR family transcriptional regulator [Sphaerochaetaceae bacterium]